MHIDKWRAAAGGGGRSAAYKQCFRCCPNMNYACRHLISAQSRPPAVTTPGEGNKLAMQFEKPQTRQSTRPAKAADVRCMQPAHRFSKAWRCTKLSVLIQIESAAGNENFALPSRQYFGQYIAWVEAYITQQVRKQ